VIDFCLTKEYFFKRDFTISKLKLNWTSKASSTQRAGRVGRTQDGYIFRMIPFQFYQRLSPFSIAELTRHPLEKLILKIKLLSKREKNYA